MKCKHPSGLQLRTAVTAIVLFIVLSVVFGFFETRTYYQRRDSALYRAANQTQLLEGSLETIMAQVYSLRALVRNCDGDTSFFEEYVGELYSETTEYAGLTVRNFILAPNGIVEQVYPLEGNEGLLGLDYMDASLPGNEEALQAYERNELVLTEPFQLTQGGYGLAGRLPIYLERDGQPEFWGMASVTIDMDSLLSRFNLSYLEDDGMDYRLWYDSDGTEVTLDASDTLPNDPVTYEVHLGNLSWKLEVAPHSGWLPVSEIGLGLLVILVVTVLATHAIAANRRVQNVNSILEQIVMYDALTGCYSRHYLDAVLLMDGSRSWKDPNADYSLAVIDVDLFKLVNDTYGHDIGDKALIAVGEVLRGQCNDLCGDCVIRYGGDEFVLLMDKVHRERFEQVLQNIVVGVRDLRIEGAPELRLSVSVGGICCGSKKSYYALFAAADEQVYVSKQAGRDQFHLV